MNAPLHHRKSGLLIHLGIKLRSKYPGFARLLYMLNGTLLTTWSIISPIYYFPRRVYYDIQYQLMGDAYVDGECTV